VTAVRQVSRIPEGEGIPVGQVVRYIGVGGFLGAGKTTALAKLAGYYTAKGWRVGIVTNDQAGNLVDTGNLENEGNLVKEVAGGCFCCKFNDLIEAITSFQSNNAIDLILAEPVGSCTDVVATVIRPLLELYGQTIIVAPHSVLIDPMRLKNILMEEEGVLSNNVAYIYKKQLEEADILVLNKIDSLRREDLVKLVAYLENTFSGKKVVSISALNGDGVEEWISMLEGDGPAGTNIVNVNYDIYADGEARLGWLNATARLSGPSGFHIANFLTGLLSSMQGTFVARQKEIAHIKVLLKTDNGITVANLITNSYGPVISKITVDTCREAELVVNARVEVDPELLKSEILKTIYSVSQEHDVAIEVLDLESFKPGRPQPTHRYAGPVGA